VPSRRQHHLPELPKPQSGARLIERAISPFTVHRLQVGLDLPAFLAQAGLQPVSIEKVNIRGSGRSSRASRPETEPLLAGLALTLCCSALFVGLGRADIENDEAIYSFAVDRILETGNWLEPKSIPTEDFPSSKASAQFWIVGALMRLSPPGSRRIRHAVRDAVAGGAAFSHARPSAACSSA
jgi:hypothetical protein